ncbi:MAG: ATP-binding cassette domain-containing protein [Clostridiales bacterium]|jgi:ABC-2 type transport system ATP-binding protein|nr:ATP-binding cassette domain-containing protein [Clostridiales bacterium]
MVIQLTEITKKYGDKTAVNGLNFTVEQGEILGFLGPNGAGKSTTMNIITGYIMPTSGSVEITKGALIGYLPEQPPLYLDMTVREYLNFVYELKKVKLPRKEHLKEIMEMTKIDDVEKRLLKNLSKGYRQRVGIAQALVGSPQILILDEPTVGLDPKQIVEIRELITTLAQNHTIILSSHIMQEISAVATRVVIISNGELVAEGTIGELTSGGETLEQVFLRVTSDEAAYARALEEGQQEITQGNTAESATNEPELAETNTTESENTNESGTDTTEGTNETLTKSNENMTQNDESKTSQTPKISAKTSGRKYVSLNSKAQKKTETTNYSGGNDSSEDSGSYSGSGDDGESGNISGDSTKETPKEKTPELVGVGEFSGENNLEERNDTVESDL